MTDPNHKEFVKLGWRILEAKYAYYIMDAPLYEDHEYDQMERRYDDLAKLLGLPPSASDMVGFDTRRPACWLVMEHWGITRQRRKDEQAAKSKAQEGTGLD